MSHGWQVGGLDGRLLKGTRKLLQNWKPSEILFWQQCGQISRIYESLTHNYCMLYTKQKDIKNYKIQQHACTGWAITLLTIFCWQICERLRHSSKNIHKLIFLFATHFWSSLFPPAMSPFLSLVSLRCCFARGPWRSESSPWFAATTAGRSRRTPSSGEKQFWMQFV